MPPKFKGKGDRTRQRGRGERAAAAAADDDSDGGDGGAAAAGGDGGGGARDGVDGGGGVGASSGKKYNRRYAFDLALWYGACGCGVGRVFLAAHNVAHFVCVLRRVV